MEETKKCPYCAELIKEEANVCRFCKSNLKEKKLNNHNFRNHPEKQILGICASLSKSLNVPLVAVRIVFIILTFFHGLGLFIYFGLYFFIPYNINDGIPVYGIWLKIKNFLGIEEKKN